MDPAMQIAINQQQATLDQLWAALEANEVSLQQVQGALDQGGILSTYLLVLVLELRLKRLRRIADDT